MGEAIRTDQAEQIKLEAAAQTAAIQMAQADAWAVQQKEAVYANGFNATGMMDGSVRLAFTEKMRGDLPASVRCALILPGEVVDKLLENIAQVRAQQRDAMVKPEISPVSNGAETLSG